MKLRLASFLAFFHFAFIVNALVLPPCTGDPSQIGGIVFRDYNASGVKENSSSFNEPGISGITVRAYDSNDLPGNPTATTTSASDGTYLLTGLSNGTNYRIEFSWTAAWLQPGVAGGTTLQFAAAGSCNVNAGVNNPADYCQSDPGIFTNCYVEHNQLTGPNSTLDVLVNMPYSSGNTTATTPGIDLPAHATLAVANQIGTTYGLAYQKTSQSVFAGAFMKRHCGFGPDSTGAIYKIDVTTGSVSTFLDLNALFGAGTAGANPHPNAATDSDAWKRDANAWDGVGKIAIGDIDISEDELTMWAINLADRKLYKIPLSSKTNPTAPPAGQITRYPSSGNLSGLPGTGAPNPTTDVRPFGLGIKDGTVYVGMIVTAESTQLKADMKGLVYAFDPATEVFTKVLEFPLNYARGNAVRQSSSAFIPADWNPWNTAFTVLGPVYSTEYAYPQPILSDIVFVNDQMVIGLRDRFGDQMGYEQLHPTTGSTLYRGDSAGDLLRASPNGSGGWTIENNAQSNPSGSFGPSSGAGNSQGPGGGEFYYQDRFPVSTTAIHDEVIVGGLLSLAGFPDVAATQFDPVDASSTAFDGGIFWMSNSTGQRSRAYRVFDGGGSSNISLGKANGLGDLEAMCNPAPLEIGNRIWNDLDKDGIQDPGEPGIDGVKVKLYKNGIAVDSTTSAGGGFYGFSDAPAGSAPGFVYAVDSLMPDMSYEVRIEGFANQAPLTGLVLTPADNGGSDGSADLRDSDGTLSGNDVLKSFSTGNAGENNHAFDFGFTCPDIDISLDTTNVSCPGLSDGNIQVTVLTGQSPFDIDWDNGSGTSGNTLDETSPYDITNLPIGTYTITVTDDAGCSGTNSIQLQENPNPAPSMEDQDICEGETATFDAGAGYSDYVWSSGENTQTIMKSVADTYAVTVTDGNGCTGTATAVLTVLPNSSSELNVTICEGDSYNFDGQDYTESGTYMVNYVAANGCDSTVTLNLTVLPVPLTEINASICEGESYDFNGSSLSTGGIYMDTVEAANGCDSIITLTLIVNDIETFSFDAEICEESSYFFNGLFLMESGTYFDTLTASSGCDSIVTLNLTVLPNSLTTIDVEICEGESYFFDDQNYSEEGTYTASYTAANGCDSTAVLNLTVLPVSYSEIETSICEGESYDFNGSSLSTGGIYMDTVAASNGCDSIVTLTLTVDDAVFSSFDETICDGETYFFNDEFLTVAGVYQDTLVSGNGCDSIVTLNLTVQIADEVLLEESICEGESYQFAGQELTEPGTYHDTLHYASGCDSLLITLDLTVITGCYPIFDLALKKTLAPGQPASAMIGDTVVFKVIVFNQGNIPVYNLEVVDYLPLGFTFDPLLNPAWIDYGFGPVTIYGGPLSPGDSVMEMISLIVNSNATEGALNNYAEIAGADDDNDPNNTPPVDIDSQPDILFGNDAGGQVNSPSDDAIDGDGSGTPNDANPDTDEDDQDGAAVEFIPPRLSIGNLVFEDTNNNGVFNNGEAGIGVVNVQLWNTGLDELKGNNDDVLVNTMDTDPNGEYLFTGLIEGLYYVKLTGYGIPSGYVSSTGEGPADNDGAGPYEPSFGTDNDVDDIDDGTQMGPMIMSDTIRLTFFNEPEGNINRTVDFGLYLPDSDIFDLALRKRTDPGQPDYFRFGDQLHFTISVFNQGNVDAYNIEVVDYLPTGLSLDDPNWTLFTPGIARTVVGFLAAGDSVDISLTLKVTTKFNAFTELVNLAEIAAADDDQDPNNTPPSDIDSTPDNVRDNDAGGEPNSPTDDLITDNGSIDEDDHDPSTVVIVIPADPEGYIYCDNTGKLITGGTISVNGPGNVNILKDGSDGSYQFFTDGTPGVYTITYNHPDGYPVSSICPPQQDTLDLTVLPDPYTVGTVTLDSSGMYLDSMECQYNPYYLDIEFGLGDSVVFGNNIAVQCVCISSIVCEDTDLNDFHDGAEPGMAGITVHLYACADTLNPIMTTWTDNNGEYRFDGLTEGDYRVQFLKPANYRPIQGSNVSPDGYSPCLYLEYGECDTTFSVCFFPCPAVDAGEDVVICYGDTTQLLATVPYSSGNFNWTPVTRLSDPGIQDPLAYPTSTIVYEVIFDDGLGCMDSDSVTVTVSSSSPMLVYAPFTDTIITCAEAIPFDAPVFEDGCADDLVVTLDSIVSGTPCNYTIERTWTATNTQGFFLEFTQTVEVVDNIPPAIYANHPVFGPIVHGDTIYADCSQVSLFDSTGVFVTDQCCADVDVVFTETMIIPDCGTVGYETILHCGWVATDCCGNVDSLFFTVLLSDNTPPTFNAPAPPDLTVDCQQIPPPAILTASDICDPSVTVTVNDVLTGDSTTCDRQLIRTWAATDDCGNVATVSQTITLQDSEAPVITPVHPLLAGLSSGDTVYLDCIQVSQLGPDAMSFTDNCCGSPAVQFIEYVKASGSCQVEGYLQVAHCEWVATDCCGNSSNFYFTMVVVDEAPPVLYGVPANRTVNCDAVIAPPRPVIGVDNCDNNVTVTYSVDTVIIACGYQIIRTWTGSDDCGNSASKSQTITVTDLTAPVLSGVPADVTVDCGSSEVPVPPVSASDVCTPNPVVTMAADTTYLSCGYQVVRTWTAVDSCGNSASASQTITVTDTTPPVFEESCQQIYTLNTSEGAVCPANATISLSVGDEISPFDTWTAGGITMPDLSGCLSDDCTQEEDLIVKVNSILISGNACSRTFVVIFDIIDDCGNVSDNHYATVVMVKDDTPPVIIGVPDDVTVSCEAIPVAPVLTGLDNCGGTVNIDFEETQTPGCPFTITRTWTATDLCGNTSSAIQTITVEDVTVPDFDETCERIHTFRTSEGAGCPDAAAISLSISDEISPFDTWTVGTNVIPDLSGCLSDNCTGEDSLKARVAAILISGDSCAKTFTVQFDIVDACGNVSESQLTTVVTIIDDTPPAFEQIPADTTVSCDSIPAPPILNASDNCSGNVLVEFVETQTAGCPYTITRTWTATDSCGNSDSYSQTITVVDNEGPEILNVPADTTILCSDGPPIIPDNIIAIDNCDSLPVLVLTDTITGSACSYDFICIWTATDACGNQTIATQTITIIDNEGPELIGVPADTVIDCSAPLPAQPVVTASDNCDESPTLEFSEAFIPGNCGNQYQIHRTWTTTDECGNETVATQIISIVDETDPKLSGLPADTTISCSDPIPVPPIVTATDNCTETLQVDFDETIETGNCVGNYRIIRSWTTVDDCGNEASGSQVIWVEDNTPPVLHDVPEDEEVSCNSIPPAAPITVTDNCDNSVTVTVSDISTPGCPFTIYRTWVATDACGNTADSTQEITVIDTVPPYFISTPNDTSIICGEPLDTATVIAADLCDTLVALTVVDSIAGNDCDYIIYRTWTAIDDCGNEASFTQEITVTGTGNTPLPQAPSDITVSCNEELPPPATFSSMGGCESPPAVIVSDSIAIGCPYVIYRSYLVSDTCGNSNSYLQKITVIDDEAPELVFTHPWLAGLSDGDTLVMNCHEAEVLNADDAIAEDNCSNAAVYFTEGDVIVGECAADGFIVLMSCTWTAKDVCGNQTSATLHVKIVDNEAPEFIRLPSDITVECGETIPPFEDPVAKDACGAFSVTADVDTLHTSSGFDLIKTWTATDDCGNSSFISQTIHVIQAGLPILEGVPADTVIYLAAGGEIPAVATVQAYDGCSGATLTTTFFETKTPTNGGCDTTIVRTWKAIGEYGDSAAASQTILLIGNMEVEVSTTPVSCAGNDGTANLSPASYQYLWSDGETGANRSGLSEGTYSVTVQNGECADTLMVTVSKDCPCSPASLNGISTANATCGNANGTATIDIVQTESDYTYLWIPNHGTPNAAGNARTGLPAAHYIVITKPVGRNDCVAKFEFDIYDNCPRCPPVTGVSGLTVEVPYTPAKVCLPIPYGVTLDKNILVNGQTYTGPKKSCDAQSILVYNYSNAPGAGTAGPYNAIWEFNNQTFYTLVNDMDELAAGMNAADPTGAWKNNLTVNGLVSQNLNGSYGKLLLTQVSSQSAYVLPFGMVSAPMGTQVILPVGSHVLRLVDVQSGCDASISVNLEYNGTKPQKEDYPVLLADTITTHVNAAVKGNIYLDDMFQGELETVTLLTRPKHGSVTLHSDNTFTYTPEPDYCYESNEADLDGFIYEVCTDEGCLEAGVKINVACQEIKIYNGFSPNGDGYNDYLKIEGLQLYPDHHLKVLDRWGRKVFETKDYRNDWGGAWGQNDLPNGTYFYILDAGKEKTYSGYIQINR